MVKRVRGGDAEWRKSTIFSRRKPGQGRPAIYPWPDWCDGGIYEVTQGEDFQTSFATFRTGLSNRCRIMQNLANRTVLKETGKPFTGLIKVETSIFDFETGDKLPEGHLQFSFYEIGEDNIAKPIESCDFRQAVSDATRRAGNMGSQPRVTGQAISEQERARLDYFCDYTDRTIGLGNHAKGMSPTPRCPKCMPPLEEKQQELGSTPFQFAIPPEQPGRPGQPQPTRIKADEPMPPLKPIDYDALTPQQRANIGIEPPTRAQKDEEPTVPFTPVQLTPEQQAFKAFQDFQAAELRAAEAAASKSAGGGSE